jgi:hypothetical protein
MIVQMDNSRTDNEGFLYSDRRGDRDGDYAKKDCSEFW